MYICSQTKGRSRRVHGNVSAAYNRDFFACNDRRIIAVIKRLHQIASCQIFIGGKYTVCIFPRNAHEHWKTCAGSDKYGFKPFLFHKLIDGCGFTDYNVCFKFHTQFFYFFDFFCHYFLFRKTEFRDAIHKHAAQFVECLKYGHLIPHFGQIACACQSGRTGTDHGNFMSVHFFSALRLDVMFQCIICNKPLQFSDGYRLAFNAADTDTLTLRLLRADTSADCRKSAGFSDYFISLFDISFFNLMNKSRNINGYRTSFDAFGIPAVQTSLCLFHCLFLIVSKTNFIKICRTYFWILLSDRHFFQHISHYSSPPQCPHPP